MKLASKQSIIETLAQEATSMVTYQAFGDLFKHLGCNDQNEYRSILSIQFMNRCNLAQVIISSLHCSKGLCHFVMDFLKPKNN